METLLSPADAASWLPLLEGEPALRAALIIEQIADALRPLDQTDFTDLGARALLFAQLHRVRPGLGFDQLAGDSVDRAIDVLAESNAGPALFGGFAGMAWVLDQLDPTNPEDPNEEIDEALLTLLEVQPWTLDYDLISGLAGFGVYALGRLDRRHGRELLRRVVRQLEATAQPRGPGLSWLSRPELLLPATAERWPRGYYNYGVAHGVPAVALVLAGALRAGVEVERARTLYEGAQRWIWAGRLPETSPSAFRAWEQDGEATPPTRLAWCYGDAGLSTTLLSAARAVADEPRARLALDVARRSAMRPFEESGVEDAPLCHGSAGLALLYARLHHQTGEEVFAGAARRWYVHLLDQHQPGRGFGGYQALFPDGARDDASLLQGSAGIALALVSAIHPVEPSWDQLLAASLPAVRR